MCQAMLTATLTGGPYKPRYNKKRLGTKQPLADAMSSCDHAAQIWDLESANHIPAHQPWSKKETYKCVCQTSAHKYSFCLRKGILKPTLSRRASSHFLKLTAACSFLLCGVLGIDGDNNWKRYEAPWGRQRTTKNTRLCASFQHTIINIAAAHTAGGGPIDAICWSGKNIMRCRGKQISKQYLPIQLLPPSKCKKAHRR